MRCSILMFAMAFAGCVSHRVPDHTLLYTADQHINIWSYQPVEGEGFVSRPLNANERVVLKGGAVVSYDGKHVAVNKQEISDFNAVVDSDGHVHKGAFIRTFD